MYKQMIIFIYAISFHSKTYEDISFHVSIPIFQKDIFSFDIFYHVEIFLYKNECFFYFNSKSCWNMNIIYKNFWISNH